MRGVACMLLVCKNRRICRRSSGGTYIAMYVCALVHSNDAIDQNTIECIILVYLLQPMRDESQLVHNDANDNVGQIYNKKGHVEELPKAGSVNNKP